MKKVNCDTDLSVCNNINKIYPTAKTAVRPQQFDHLFVGFFACFVFSLPKNTYFLFHFIIINNIINLIEYNVLVLLLKG